MNFRKIVGKSLAVIVLSTYFTSSASAAESTKSLEEDAAEQLSVLQEQQERKQELEKEMDTAETSLQEIQSSMTSVQEDIGQVVEQINEVKEKINENKEEIVALEESMYTRQSLIEDRLVAMQQNSKDNVLLDILLNSDNFVEMLQRAYSVFVLFDADKDILESQQADLDQLEKVMAEIEGNEQTLLQRQQQLKEKQTELTQLEVSQQNTLKAIQTKYEEINDKIELTKAEQEKIEAKIVALETAAKEEAKLLQMKAEAEKASKAEETPSVEETSNTEVKENNTNSSQSGTAENTQKEQSSAEGKVLYVTATAYTPAESTTGKTALGYDVWANPNMKVIAVDPNVIPLGSRVWVEGYGEAIAGDTGGAIKGYKIDVLLPTVQQALNWGRKTVKIIVLN